MTETNAQLSASGELTVSDIDLTDTVDADVASVAIDGSGTFAGTVPTSLTDSGNAALVAMMTLSPSSGLAADPSSGTSVAWTFESDPSGDGAFEFLAKDETLVLVYSLTVTDDSGASGGEVTDTSTTVTVTVTGSNDTPDITATDDAGAVTEGTDPVEDNPNTDATESGAYLTDAGSIDYDDLDLTDASSVTSSFVSATVTSGTGSVSSDLDTALQNLTDTFLISGDGIDAPAHDGTVTWTFAVDDGLLQYLAGGEVITATYRITVQDDSGVAADALPNEIDTRTQDVVITLTGVNDAPVIAVESGDSAAETLTETDAGLSVSNSLTVADVDDTDTVAATVPTVAKSGTTTGIGLSDTTLLGYLTLASANVIADGATTGTISWTFDSGDEAFDYLDDGESLILTYTVRATDSHTTAATDDQSVAITIAGTNDAPTVTSDPTTYAPNEAADASVQDLSASGDVDFDDVDASDVVDITAAYANDIAWTKSDTSSAGTLDGALVTALTSGTFTAATDDAGAPGTTPWNYAANDLDLDFLAAGETITFSYTLTATDDSDATDTAAVTITITGTNDGPSVTATAATGIDEAVDASAQDLSDGGTVSFDDPDANDLVDVISASKGNIAWSDGTIDGTLATKLVNGFGITTVTDGPSPGTTPWTYSVAERRPGFPGRRRDDRLRLHDHSDRSRRRDSGRRRRLHDHGYERCADAERYRPDPEPDRGRRGPDWWGRHTGVGPGRRHIRPGRERFDRHRRHRDRDECRDLVLHHRRRIDLDLVHGVRGQRSTAPRRSVDAGLLRSERGLAREPDRGPDDPRVGRECRIERWDLRRGGDRNGWHHAVLGRDGRRGNHGRTDERSPDREHRRVARRRHRRHHAHRRGRLWSRLRLLGRRGRSGRCEYDDGRRWRHVDRLQLPRGRRVDELRGRTGYVAAVGRCG